MTGEFQEYEGLINRVAGIFGVLKYFPDDMSDEEVEAKFYVLTEWALPRERQDAVLRFLWSLDSQANLQPLMELLAV